jgi:hypothetical protein
MRIGIGKSNKSRFQTTLLKVTVCSGKHEGTGDAMGLRFTEHILAYSELLFRWDLLHKRSELLKCLPKDDTVSIMRDIANQQELGR